MKFIKTPEIIKLLEEGWELGMTSGIIYRHIWIQKGGFGKGEETKDIHLSTLRSIIKRGIIVREKERVGDGYNVTRYGLKKKD